MQVLTVYSRWKNNSIQKGQSQPMMPRSCSDPLRPATAPRLHRQARPPTAPRLQAALLLHGEARLPNRQPLRAGTRAKRTRAKAENAGFDCLFAMEK